MLLFAAGLLCLPGVGFAQAAPATPATVTARGTVKSIAGNTITITTDQGQPLVFEPSDSARLLQLEPGSTDLKSAQTITLADIAVGDRVLVTSKNGDTGPTLTALRIILMKAADLAQKHAAEAADWQKRGSGGLVTAVDSAEGVITITSGSRKIMVLVAPTTIYRRYAAGSVKFEDAQPSTLVQIQPGDQLRVRGDRGGDGGSIQAEEIVSGAFRNISGTIASINVAASSLTIKDLISKKTVTVAISANADLRKLPAQMATMMAARLGPQPAGATPAGATPPAGGTRPAPAPGADASAPGGGRPRGGQMDLASMISRLATTTLAELKPGDALMIVASPTPAAGADTVSAITLLSGVELLLQASPNQTMTLSPWSIGGGMPEGGGL